MEEFIEYLSNDRDFIIENKDIPLHIYLFIFQHRSKIWNDDQIFGLICINEEFLYLASIGDDDIDEKLRLHICVEKNYFNCFKMLLNCHYPWDEDTCILAIMHNRIEYIKYLHEFYCIYKEFPFTYKMAKILINNGNLDILQYLYKIKGGMPDYRKSYYEIAVQSENNHILKFLEQCEKN